MMEPAPADGATADEFGSVVSVSAGVGIIGAAADDDAGSASGSAYIFANDGSGDWVEIDKLTASDAAAADQFGASVALSDLGDMAIIGARGDDDHGSQSGAAYIFADNGAGDWIEIDKVTPADGAGGDDFGVSVAISGKVVLIGAWDDDDNGSNSGSAYIFRNNGLGTWSEDAKIIASDGFDGDRFANAVALSGDNAVIGAFEDDDVGVGGGSAYIFDLSCLDADLSDFAFVFGAHLTGDLTDLLDSDDQWLEGRSQFGFSALEPNIIDLLTGAESPIVAPTSIDLVIESHLNNPGGAAGVRLKNWNTGQFEEVAIFAPGQEDMLEAFTDIDASNYVQTGDRRIELSVRMSVIATFSAAGFDAFFDWIEVVIE